MTIFIFVWTIPSSFDFYFGLSITLKKHYSCFYKVCMCLVWYLHTMGDFFTVRQDLCQVFCTQHIPQGGLCQQTSGRISVGDVGHCQCCVLNTVVDYTIYTHRHWVLCQNLWGNTQGIHQGDIQQNTRKTTTLKSLLYYTNINKTLYY